MKTIRQRCWNSKLYMIIGLLFFGTSIHAQNTADNILKSIKNYPDSLELHQEYIKTLKLETDELIRQYETLIEQFSESAIVPFALAESLWRRELPEAKQFLLKAVERNPNFAKAYYYLWIDGQRWGDFKQSREYLLKAKQIEPDNPDYAFYYASTFDTTDFDVYEKLSLEVAIRFPESERGAQALYWLAYKSSAKTDKQLYYELLKEKFPPSKFSWSSSGMYGYFDLVLESEPEKAIVLAKSMLKVLIKERDQKTWKDQLEVAQNVVQANAMLASNKPSEAFDILEKTKLTRWSSAHNFLLLLKAKALDRGGKTIMAYEVLKYNYAKSPEPELVSALNLYGEKLNKNEVAIQNDIRLVRDTIAKKATDFSLKEYFGSHRKSLADYKGKVILLTYWFPGCGPCRGEFPHFQNVVDKFDERDLAYLGLNIAPEQNDYVIPFLNSSGYSFIPLEDYKERQKGNLDNRGAAPVNFLIDREGNIVYSNFRTHGDNEDVLEAMISSLINRN